MQTVSTSPFLAVAYLCGFAILSLTLTPSLAFALQDAVKDRYTESLHLRPLSNGRVHSALTFTLSSDAPLFDSGTSGTNGDHFQLLPPLLTASLQSSILEVEELHLSLNKGRWDYHRWGMPTFVDSHGLEWGSPMVSNGAEAWARFSEAPSENVTQRDYIDAFHTILSALSGQFCSSLAASGSLEAISEPSNITRGLFPQSNAASEGRVFHLSQSPTPCTEVLHPVLSLLPCKTRAGLASLLEPHGWLQTDWHGIEVAIRRVGAAKDNWEIQINVGSVWNPIRNVGDGDGKRDFSLSNIFGRSLESACPLASTSFISLLKPEISAISFNYGLTDSVVEPIPLDFVAEILESISDTPDLEEDEVKGDSHATPATERLFAQYFAEVGEALYYTDEAGLETQGPLDISLRFPNETRYSLRSSGSPPHTLRAERGLISSDQIHGYLLLRLINGRPDCSKRIIYRDVLPWYLSLDVSSAEASISLGDLPANSPFIRFEDDLFVDASPVIDLHFEASVPRHSPATLEAEIVIPPLGTLEWKIPFHKETIRYEEHPPDAHRGLEIGSGTVWEVEDDFDYDGQRERRSPVIARVEASPSDSRGVGSLSIHCLAPALIEVPIPDFSMPYNVIIFTSTLIALFAGSALNLMARRYRDVQIPPIPIKKQSKGKGRQREIEEPTGHPDRSRLRWQYLTRRGLASQT